MFVAIFECRCSDGSQGLLTYQYVNGKVSFQQLICVNVTLASHFCNLQHGAFCYPLSANLTHKGAETWVMVNLKKVKMLRECSDFPIEKNQSSHKHPFVVKAKVMV
jgi:hypothetical protein